MIISSVRFFLTATVVWSHVKWPRCTRLVPFMSTNTCKQYWCVNLFFICETLGFECHPAFILHFKNASENMQGKYSLFFLLLPLWIVLSLYKPMENIFHVSWYFCLPKTTSVLYRDFPKSNGKKWQKHRIYLNAFWFMFWWDLCYLERLAFLSLSGIFWMYIIHYIVISSTSCILCCYSQQLCSVAVTF